jgi:hypothetical protein
VSLIELIQRKPYDFFISVHVEFFSESRGYLRDAGLSVAALPDEGGGPVQAMSLVAIQIIDQQFIRHFLNN